MYPASSAQVTELLANWGQGDADAREALVPLVYQKAPQWQNRAHYFGVAAQVMRQILVDYARGRLVAKRGAGAPRFTLDTKIALPQKGKEEVDLVALDDALHTLAGLDPRQSRIIELRFFGGLSIQGTAAVLGISPARVEREWAMARMWLRRQMIKDEGR